MHYIVLDLEWNQPLSYQSAVYRRVGDRLIFEMIQIGAVKLGDHLEITDAVSIPIAPTQYLQIHPRIRRMTGLGPEELAGAPAFREALEQFSAWCGKDYVLLTWGCDDVSVLQQNIDFFECGDIPLAPLCDIQKLFAEVHQLKERSSLRAAMELLKIEPDENMAFHNAKNDAWYTALVFRTLPDPSAVMQYVQQPKNLIHKHHRSREKTPGEQFDSVQQALQSEPALQPVCPRCGRILTLDGEYVMQSADKYIALAKCRHHGKMLIRLRLHPEEENRLVMQRSAVRATPSNIAYVHTKQFQNQQREEAWLAEHESLPDPDEALRHAERSSMPFD